MSYTAGYGAPVVAALGRRSAVGEAGFLLPHLTAGTRLLDAGCGPGSITLDLAALVAPGPVLGVDVSPVMVARASAAAAERRVPNARFVTGSVMALPVADATFDTVLAHALLEHLADPRAALVELRRVLVPGGLIALRDADHGGVLLAPRSPELDEAMGLWERLWSRNGGDPGLGRRHRALLREAGFRDIHASASYDTCGIPDETRAFAALMAYQFSASENARALLELGWVDAPGLARLAAAWEAWGAHPDAFFARPRCEALAWKP
jgi:SAM-dependent methyltransferase